MDMSGGPTASSPGSAPDPSQALPGAVTQYLAAAAAGDEQAVEDLVRVVYAELRSLAEARLRKAPAGNTLQATALVHEAYLRLVGKPGGTFEGRGHFFFAAARAMRDVLVERARRREARVRRESARATDPSLLVDPLGAPDHELLALDEALDRLRQHDPRKHELVMLRFFGGLEFAAIADLLAVSERTVLRDWRFAKAFLHEALGGESDRARGGA